MTDIKSSNRIAVFWTGPANRSCAHLFSELARFIAERRLCRTAMIDLTSRSFLQKIWTAIRFNVEKAPLVYSSEVIVLHTTILTLLPLVVLAKILRKKIVLFQWDVYPASIAGVEYKASFFRSVFFFLDKHSLRFADEIIVPSEDFRSFIQARDIKVMPLWPEASLALKDFSPVSVDGENIQICFAGQINPLRGLDKFLLHLQQIASPERIVIHVYSDDRLPENLIDLCNERISITHHGILSRADLQKTLRKMHFGLISLHPQMDTPGYPSKTFDYVAAGVPLLYFGRKLPDYTRMLEGCGIGVDITELTNLDLSELYLKLAVKLKQGRLQFIAQTQLDWARFDKIL
jgi:glycosyltransferase involved in cell wall biosynthesis